MSLYNLASAVICRNTDKPNIKTLDLPNAVIKDLEKNFARLAAVSDKDYNSDIEDYVLDNLIELICAGEQQDRRIVAAIQHSDYLYELYTPDTLIFHYINHSFYIYNNDGTITNLLKCHHCFKHENDTIQAYEQTEHSILYGCDAVLEVVRNKNNWCSSCLFAPLFDIFD
ncbi:hypothetical protein JTE90_013707 [Oedothorax gibbosus]|uniref:Uncharacterized protein n=1 Tax=Oedothorax gibbosus TaxID=931172 RepID=A0AAV6TFX9_9ARAC|nr:hypothetical protein JTE90_013707 [Oedothorax gibbosus]